MDQDLSNTIGIYSIRGANLLVWITGLSKCVHGVNACMLFSKFSAEYVIVSFVWNVLHKSVILKNN